MLSVFRLLPLLALPVVLNGCQLVTEKNQPSPPTVVITSEQQQQANHQAETIFSAYTEWRLETSPVLASFSGIRGQFDWDDISAEAREQQLESLQGFRSRLKAINEAALSLGNLGSYHTLMNELEYQLLLAPLQQLQDPLATNSNWLIRVEATLLKHHPISNIQDAHDYIARINALSSLLTRWQEALTERFESGYVSPAFAYQQSIDRLNIWLNNSDDNIDSHRFNESNLFWQDFQKKLADLALYPSSRQLLLKKMKRALSRSALPALNQLLVTLQQQHKQAPNLISLEQQSQGMRYYQLQLQHFSQTEMDANQLFQFALSELKGIQQQVLAFAQRNGWSSSQEQAKFNELRSWLRQQQPPFSQQTEKQLVTPQLLGFQQQTLTQLAQQLPYEFTDIPQTPLAVTQGVSLPGRYTSEDQNFAYIPAPDSGAAQFRWNPDALGSFSRAQLALTMASYSVPGLHMQLALAAENEQLPAFRRLPYHSRFNSGWQLYSQQLALTNYTDTASQLMFWHNQMTQLVLMVIDSGIHAKGWQRLKALEFVQNNLLNELPQAQSMVDQVLLNPAESSEKYLNFQALRQLRTNIQKKLQPVVLFDEARYHSHLLQLGALPQEALAQQMNRWADELIQQAARDAMLNNQ
jgi:uncharacterized protein (DUF885 family)